MRLEWSSSYRRRVRVALACAIVLHALLLVFLPPFQLRPAAVGAAPAPPDTVYFAPPDDYVPFDPPPEPPGPNVDPTVYREEATDDPAAPPPPPGGANGPAGPVLMHPTPRPFTGYERPPEMIAWDPPRYPALAREAGIEGTVSVRVLVDELGRAVEAVVVSSDATPAMERAALEAALRTRFQPALQQHVPVPAYVLIPYEFHLDR